MAEAWHAKDLAQLGAALQADLEQGLSAAEAALRLQQYGPNALPAPRGRSALLRFCDQLRAPLVLILIAAALVTASLGEWADTAAIAGVVLLNALIGFVQEGRAVSALTALARQLGNEATVRRAGVVSRINANALVPGDLVVIAAGERVSADLRLIEARGLAVEEAALTGESAAVAKQPGVLEAERVLAERSNMLHAGTLVVSGQGLALVVATGLQTATGHIASLMQALPNLDTPLTQKMARFSLQVLVAILALAALTFCVGLVRGESAVEMFMAAVALAVGAIPEGLPAAITITLAIGVARMARRRAIIRKLPAVETLGSTTVICSDKTGTLTENAMTVRMLYVGDRCIEVAGEGYRPQGGFSLDGQPYAADAALQALLRCGLLCNDSTLREERGEWLITGDPTEAALRVVARKAALDEAVVAAAPRLDVLPFAAANQYMATLHRDGAAQAVYLKGALEQVLPRCATALGSAGADGALQPAAIEQAAAQLAAQGLRVLALADGPYREAQLAAPSLQGLRFLGLVAMIDPPRAVAAAAVADCQRAGIVVKMITGDHALTAAAIARALGIDAARVLSGRELAALQPEAFAEAAAQCDVFARVEPEQKLRLVQALQARGEVVAMTGDGVNDAPALRAADIGVAMGRGGTDVARDAAHMVLTDDNFATIRAAVEEGRGVHDNLVKFIVWTLPTNAAEGLLIVVAVLLGVTLPVTPLQVLWINMTTAVFLGLALAFEPLEPGVMQRPPRPPQAPLLDPALVQRMLLASAALVLVAFALFRHAIGSGATLEVARTQTLNVFVVAQIFYLFNCRSLSAPVWRLPRSNPWVWGGVALMLVLQGLITYWPPMQAIFATAALSAIEWLQVGLAGLAVSLLVALEKTFRKLRERAVRRAQH